MAVPALKHHCGGLVAGSAAAHCCAVRWQLTCAAASMALLRSRSSSASCTPRAVQQAANVALIGAAQVKEPAVT
jgi:hypothetical protein